MKRKKKISKKLEGALFSRMELLLFGSTEVLPFTEHLGNLECWAIYVDFSKKKIYNPAFTQKPENRKWLTAQLSALYEGAGFIK